MSSTSATRVVATPTKSAAATSPTLVTDSPGNWRHPRLSEITRRRNATTFSEKNVRQIAYNIAALAGLWLLQLFFQLYVSTELFSREFRTYLSWGYFLAQAIPLLNIGLAILPLLRPADDLEDIPLTADQRKLLGLRPSSVAATPETKYATPPRYSRTPSISGSVASRASYTSSPLSGRGSPAVGAKGANAGSPYSPLPTPLQQKAFNPNVENKRRSSFGSPSPLGASTASTIFPEVSTPSPSAGKRMSVGLNNKWLYEKGRRSSGGSWMQ